MQQMVHLQLFAAPKWDCESELLAEGMKEGGAASNHWPVVERQSFRGDCCRPVVMRIPVPFSKIDDFSQFTNRSPDSAHHKSVVVGLTLLRGSVFKKKFF